MAKITYPALALFALAGFALLPQARALCLKGCDGDDANTFLGNDALRHNTGLENTAVGFDALFSNTSGLSNIAVGFDALYFNTLGDYNTAIGTSALYQNTTGSANVAVGYGAMAANKGDNNTATGVNALLENTTGTTTSQWGIQLVYRSRPATTTSILAVAGWLRSPIRFGSAAMEHIPPPISPVLVVWPLPGPKWW